jgi:hypothetical protein
VKRWLTLAALGGVAWGVGTPAQASLRYCEPLTTLSAPQQDQMLRFTAAVKAQLAQSGQPAALVSRSGLDLSRIGLRYSHAGISSAQPQQPLGGTPALLRLRRAAAAPL